MNDTIAAAGCKVSTHKVAGFAVQTIRYTGGSTVDMLRRRAKTVATIYRNTDGTCMASIVGRVELDLITSDYREAILHVLAST